MYDLHFINVEDGQMIGEAPRERTIPMEGRLVVLEHAVFGPVRYRVAKLDEHWFKARLGRTGKADQYAGSSVKVYLQTIEGGR